MSAPLPSEFAALVPAESDRAVANTDATGAELRKILLGTGNEDSLADLMKKWMENWFDNSGAISGQLETQLCALDCVQNAPVNPSVPTTTTTLAPGSTTTTTTTTTTTPAPTTSTSTTTTQWPATIRTFGNAEAGDKIRWSNLPAGTYNLRWYSGNYEIVTGFATNYYGTVQGVHDGASPLGGTLDTTQEDAEAAGQAFNDAGGRSYTVAEGGEIELEMQWMAAGSINNSALSFVLTKTA